MMTLEDKTKLVEMAMADEKGCKAMIAFGRDMYKDGLVKGGITVAALMITIACAVSLVEVGIEVVKGKKPKEE